MKSLRNVALALAAFGLLSVASLLHRAQGPLLRTHGPQGIEPSSVGQRRGGALVGQLSRPHGLQGWQQQQQCGASVAAFPANFWLVKVHKTGGSTLAGVFRAIAAHYGVHPLEVLAVNRNNTLAHFNATLAAALSVLSKTAPVGICGHLPYDGAKAALLPAARAPLLRFTAVRHPLARFYSHFFHSRCYLASTAAGIRRQRGYACDSDARVLAAALARDTVEARWAHAREHSPNVQYEYVRGNTSTVAAAAAAYDFIFVTERMNEALVVFMLKYGLTFEDVAYLPAKNRTGKYKAAADMPDELNSFVLRRNALDMQLWQLANQRLDRERAALQRQCGAGAVAGALRAFEQLLRRVQQQCGDFKAWYEAHGLRGPYAYAGDAGLGFRCVQHVARQFAPAGRAAHAAAAGADGTLPRVSR